MPQSRTSIKEQLKQLLALHHAERRAFMALIVLLVLVAARVTYIQWFARPLPSDMTALEQELVDMLAKREEAIRMDSIAAEAERPPPFDPNTLDEAGWAALGLSEKQAAAVVRYRERGAVFRSKADVAKVRVISPAQFERMQPLILLPDSAPEPTYHAARQNNRRGTHAQRSGPNMPYPERTTYASKRTERPALAPVELNTADSAALVAVKGIGPSFARGIIAYREALGGYRSLEQLSEVYLLSDKPDAVERILPQLTLDTLMVARILINSCTVDDLAAHPYMRWKSARALIAYRDNHGPFQELADIMGCVLIDEDTFRKLAPYLSLE